MIVQSIGTITIDIRLSGSKIVFRLLLNDFVGMNMFRANDCVYQAWMSIRDWFFAVNFLKHVNEMSAPLRYRHPLLLALLLNLSCSLAYSIYMFFMIANVQIVSRTTWNLLFWLFAWLLLTQHWLISFLCFYCSIHTATATATWLFASSKMNLTIGICASFPLCFFSFEILITKTCLIENYFNLIDSLNFEYGSY